MSRAPEADRAPSTGVFQGFWSRFTPPPHLWGSMWAGGTYVCPHTPLGHPRPYHPRLPHYGAVDKLLFLNSHVVWAFPGLRDLRRTPHTRECFPLLAVVSPGNTLSHFIDKAIGAPRLT